MRQHTPGPFTIGQESTELMHPDVVSTGSRYHAIDAPGHGAIAVVVTRMADDSSDEKSTEQLLANAHLFAAGPAMLAELTTVVFHLRRNDFKNNETLRQQAIDSIEKTIAKATGGAS